MQLGIIPQIPEASLLHHFGGKTQLAKWTNNIISFAIAKYRISPIRYGEVFGGEFAVGMRRIPMDGDFYNEINPNTFNFMMVLKTQTDELIEKIYSLPWETVEGRHAAFRWAEAAIYYERGVPACKVEWATAYYTYCRLGFIGGGSRWSGGISPSRVEGMGPHPENWLRQFAFRMQNVELLNLDFEQALRRKAHPNAVFYWDPPYAMESRASRDSRHKSAAKPRRQYLYELSEARFQEMPLLVQSTPGLHIIAGYQCNLTDRLFGSWQRFDKGATDLAKNKRVESLWIFKTA
ncbi:MAG TPA: DNA adenine methylase [Trichocoleus sp.]